MTLAALLEETTPAAPVWPAGLPDHLSASQMTMFQRCPEQYRRRYLLGEVARPGGALVWGSADHYAHEQNFAQKITSGEDITEDDVRVAFAEGFDRAVERNGGNTEVDWGTDQPGDLKDRGVELVAAYHRQVSPRIQPVAVESRFEVRMPGVPVPLIGFVDVTTSDRGIERKTAARKETQPKPDWRIQGLLYQAQERKAIEWHVSTKTKTPAVYTPDEEPGLLLGYDVRAAAAAERLVLNVAQAILAFHATFGPDQPWPGAITHPWACGFCGFRPSCPWWGA